jgi:hypothetical protein
VAFVSGRGCRPPHRQDLAARNASTEQGSLSDREAVDPTQLRFPTRKLLRICPLPPGLCCCCLVGDARLSSVWSPMKLVRFGMGPTHSWRTSLPISLPVVCPLVRRSSRLSVLCCYPDDTPVSLSLTCSTYNASFPFRTRMSRKLAPEANRLVLALHTPPLSEPLRR